MHPASAQSPLNDATWKAIVGEDLGAHSRPIEMVGVPADALLIEADTSAWAQQIGFLSDRIIREVQTRGVDACRLRIRIAAHRA